MEGRWLEGGSVVSWVGLLAIQKVEEGGTRMDVVRCPPLRPWDDDWRRWHK
jgi:hypothetical protein